MFLPKGKHLFIRINQICLNDITVIITVNIIDAIDAISFVIYD